MRVCSNQSLCRRYWYTYFLLVIIHYHNLFLFWGVTSFFHALRLLRLAIGLSFPLGFLLALQITPPSSPFLQSPAVHKAGVLVFPRCLEYFDHSLECRGQLSFRITRHGSQLHERHLGMSSSDRIQRGSKWAFPMKCA